MTSRCFVMFGVMAAMVLALAGQARADQHALLIGVGDYADPSIADLEGPPNDVAALAALLTGRLGFASGRVRTLVDRQATRQAILDALDALISETRAGDFVFVYFSGHGTSARNVQAIIPGLEPGTGAIYPADVRKTTAAEMLAQLVVGSRDLRPRLERLDRDRTVIVIFDACYSGEASRRLSVRPDARAYRFDPWPEDPQGPTTPGASFGAQTASSAPFPYRQLLYISASSENQPAVDIRARDLPFAPTVDGRPHGAFTDALLVGLRGDADANRDGQLSAGELYDFSRTRLEDREPQTPQLRHAGDRPELPEMPLFSLRGPAAGAIPRPGTAVPVWITPAGSPFARAIAGLPDVQVTAIAPQLIISADAASITLLHGSGDPIKRYSASDTVAAMTRVRRQVAALRLMGAGTSGPTFRATLQVPNQYGVFRVPRRAPGYLTTRIDYGAEVAAVFLLLNIDADGMVHVLVPYTPSETSPSLGRSIPDVRITADGVGTEFLKLIAFDKAPPGLFQWIGERVGTFPADDPKATQLLEFVRAAPGRTSEARLKIVTELEDQ